MCLCVIMCVVAARGCKEKRYPRGRGSHKAAGTCLGCPLEIFCILLIRTSIAVRLSEHGSWGKARVRIPEPADATSPLHTPMPLSLSPSLEDQRMSFPVNFSSFSDFPNPNHQASLLLSPSQAQLYCFLSSCMIRHMCYE